MTAKEFLLKKINTEWEYDLRDVSYDNLETLSKALNEYAEMKNNGGIHHVGDKSQMSKSNIELLEWKQKVIKERYIN